MVQAQQLTVSPGQTRVQPGQTLVQPGQVTVSPYAPTAAQNGFDIGLLLTSIMPLIMMIMVFSMLKPMFKGMTEMAK
ncbi:unnamed protein product [marine sediment metagenome]|uniref:Uncharacterized protein n=1 Tax=marine sediment metagenome TaxID=412755 RepID=X1PSG5_9ZZZZ